jgi:hypothetical protein
MMYGNGEVDWESIGRFPDLSRNINTNCFALAFSPSQPHAEHPKRLFVA